jgi:hypothetical protein
MSTTETKIGGFITENDSQAVADTFGNEVAELLNKPESNGKTFLQILMESGRI